MEKPATLKIMHEMSKQNILDESNQKFEEGFSIFPTKQGREWENVMWNCCSARIRKTPIWKDCFCSFIL